MKNENMFREKLYHHTVPVRDGLWDAIEAQLPPEKKRKAFPLFWFTLFGTTLLGAAVMIGIFNNKVSDQPLLEKHQTTPSLIASNSAETSIGTESSSSTHTSTSTSTTTTTTIFSTFTSTFWLPCDAINLPCTSKHAPVFIFDKISSLMVSASTTH